MYDSILRRTAAKRQLNVRVLLRSKLQIILNRGMKHRGDTAIHCERSVYMQLTLLLPTPAIGCSAESVSLCVCLRVRALKGKRLELSTPNLLRIRYSTAVARHARFHSVNFVR